MRLYIVLLLCCMLVGCKSNSGDFDSKQTILATIRTTCKEDMNCYIRQAKLDYKEGHFRAYCMGLMEDSSFDYFYSICLHQQGIEVIGAGCIRDTGLEVYNKTMALFIKDSLGNDYFDICISEAEQLSGKKGYPVGGLWY